MTEIRVPTLGELVTEATIGKWFKQPGDAVAVDEPLVELETDKVTIEVPAPAAGVLSEIAAKDGETVAVGAVLGQIKDGRRRRAKAAAPPRKAGRSAAAPAASGQTRAAPRQAAGKCRRRAAGAVGAKALRRIRRRCRDACPAPARTAASPRATCWRPSSAPPRSRRRSRRPPPRPGPRAVAGRRCRARGTRAHDAAARRPSRAA